MFCEHFIFDRIMLTSQISCRRCFYETSSRSAIILDWLVWRSQTFYAHSLEQWDAVTPESCGQPVEVTQPWLCETKTAQELSPLQPLNLPVIIVNNSNLGVGFVMYRWQSLAWFWGQKISALSPIGTMLRSSKISATNSPLLFRKHATFDPNFLVYDWK